MRNTRSTRNIEIRRAAKDAGVYLWEIAEALEISEFTLIRHLRKELSESEREQFLTIIKELSEKNM